MVNIYNSDDIFVLADRRGLVYGTRLSPLFFRECIACVAFKVNSESEVTVSLVQFPPPARGSSLPKPQVGPPGPFVQTPSGRQVAVFEH